MGTYHSYVGDAKLEDSKDNWYRISGMNISRWNFTTWGNVNRSLWEYAAGGEFVLAKAGRGLAGKSHWSDLLYKALKQDDALTLPRGESMPTGVVDGFVKFAWTGGNNNMDSLDIAGNSFDFKNRLTKADGAADTLALNCTTSQGGLYGKAGTLFYNMYNIESTLHTNNYYFRDTPIEPNRNSCCFRPMLTLKPVGGGVIDKFTLKIRVTRYFSYITTQLYRLGYTVSILEGNESIIAERKYGYRIGRNGEELPDTAPFATRAVANQYFTTTNPPEVIAHTTPWGDDTVTDHLGWWWKLINGKCLYIPSFSRLPGMEQDWRDNGGVTTSDITFTEADAYTI